MKRYIVLIALAITVASVEAKVTTLRAESEFNELAKKPDSNAVVRVFAPWCGPCKQSHPNFDAISNEFVDKVTYIAINYDQFKQLASKLYVQSLPTWIYFKNGIEVMRHSGAASVQVLRKNIKQAFGL